MIKKAFSRWGTLCLAALLAVSSAQSVFAEDGDHAASADPPASRESAVAAFMDAAGIEGAADTRALSRFTDTSDVERDDAPLIARAVEAGWIQGYEDATLRPKAAVTRVEALVILSRMIPSQGAIREAVDFPDVPVWAKTSIDRLSAEGLVEGYENGILGASDHLTLNELRILSDRIMNTTPAVYLGVWNYGADETNKDNKEDFRYRFLIGGKETVLSADNGPADSEGNHAYPLQNILKENYPYRLCLDGDKVVSAEEVKGGAPEYQPPVAGIPGQRTLLNFLKTAMMPVGTTLYVYGGGWDWQDEGSSRQTRTIGVSPDWVRFFREKDENYTYKEKDGDPDQADPATSYYPYGGYNEYYYAGLDCSGYLGWVLYNTLEFEDMHDGFVSGSTKMAKKLADRGYGTWTQDITPMKPGEIMSINGHVWLSLGTCADGSTLIVHSTPSRSRTHQPGGGVQLSAIGTSEDCEAYQLADRYMSADYPEWYRRYGIYLCDPDNYFTFTGENAGKFTWSDDVMSDPERIGDMTPQEVLTLLFGTLPTER